MSEQRRVDFVFGGAYRPDVRVRRESQSLARAGYQVRVLAWDRTATLAETEWDGPVRVERVRMRSRSGRGWTQLLYLARVLMSYAAAIRRNRPHILHAVDLPMLAGALLLAPLAGRPRIVYDAFEIYALMESQKYPKWLLRAIDFAEANLPRLADLVIVPGELRRRYLAERGVESIIVGNWIDAPITAPDRHAARDALGVGTSFCIAYAGSLIGSRDLDPLLHHAAAHPQDVVLIAGHGPEEVRLREVAAGLPNVRFLGWIADPSELYAAADALYYALRPQHPYAALASPNNLYVAIAHAVPLLYRPQGEVALVGAEHRIGAAFDDTRTLADAVRALREPAKSAEIRRELERLRARYSWAAAERALLAAYPKTKTTSTSPKTKGP